MMKVKVVQKFIDKHTNAIHKVGETFDVTESRLKEIQSAGHFVETVKTEKKGTEAK